MNVLWETTIAIKTLHATIVLDHLVAHAIPVSLEMEPIVKVCSVDIMLLTVCHRICGKSIPLNLKLIWCLYF